MLCIDNENQKVEKHDKQEQKTHMNSSYYIVISTTGNVGSLQSVAVSGEICIDCCNKRRGRREGKKKKRGREKSEKDAEETT